MALNVALFSQSAQTISSSEYSLTNNSTSIAVLTSVYCIVVAVDVANMAAGDEYVITLREKAVSGGTQRSIVLADLVGAQAESLFMTGSFLVGAGWDVTMTKIAGTDRAFSWSIRSAS